MSKKKITQIKPIEVMQDGKRSVQYKGRDGKMHGITEGCTAQSASSAAGQSVQVATSTSRAMQVESLLADRFYRFDATTGGSCLIATSGEDGELAVSLVGEHATELVSDIAQDGQGQWTISLTEITEGGTLTLLSDADALSELALGHQQVLEDFLACDTVAWRDNSLQGYQGTAVWDNANGAWKLCPVSQIDKNATLILVYEAGQSWRYKGVKVLRLSNHAAAADGMSIQDKAGMLLLTLPVAELQSFTVLRLCGIMGSIVEHLQQPVIDYHSGSGVANISEPYNGKRILIKEGDVAALHIHKTLNDEWYIDCDVTIPKGPSITEFVQLENPSANGGYDCYAIVNGTPKQLVASYNGGSDPSLGF